MTMHPPTAAVRESFSQAQRQAAAMVAGAPTPWNEAAQAQRKSALWIGVAAVSVVAGGVAGWLGVDWFSGSTRAASSASPRPAVVTPAPAALPTAVAPTMTTAPIAAPTSLAVTRQAGVIRIASTNASLAQTVDALAQATHTRVKGSEALASVTSPITLSWQGRDTAAAWEALLGRFASTAVSCSSAGCELWIVSVNAARTMNAPSANGASATTEPVPAPATVIAPTQPQSPQSSEENTETN